MLIIFVRALILPFNVSCHKITLATHLVKNVDLATKANTFVARWRSFGLLQA